MISCDKGLFLWLIAGILVLVSRQIGAGSVYDDKEFQEMLGKSFDKCLKEYPKVNNDTIKKLVESKFESADGDMKCFINCIGVDVGDIDASGKLMPDVVMERVPATVKKDKIKEILDGCVKEGSEKCETSFQQVKCVGLKVADLGVSLFEKS